MSTIKTIQAELADLCAKRDAHNRSHNDGGHGYNPYDSKIEDACDRLRAAKMVDYVARWPEIKAAWNAAVAKYSTARGIDMRDLPKIEAAAGITMAEIKAVKATVEG